MQRKGEDYCREFRIMDGRQSVSSRDLFVEPVATKRILKEVLVVDRMSRFGKIMVEMKMMLL